jgi:alkylhydroperoxidase family enzyme
MRIRTVNTDQAPADLRPDYEALYGQRGNVPRMFRTLAHRPELMRTALAHFRTAMETGSVGTRLKELVAVYVSTLNRCHY